MLSQREKIEPVSAPAAMRPTRVRYWVLVFTVTLAVITYIDRVAISFALPYIGKDLGLNSIQKGWVLTAFALAYSLFEIPADSWAIGWDPAASFFASSFGGRSSPPLRAGRGTSRHL